MSNRLLEAEFAEYLKATFLPTPPLPGTERYTILLTAFLSGAMAGSILRREVVVEEVREHRRLLKKMPQQVMEF